MITYFSFDVNANDAWYFEVRGTVILIFAFYILKIMFMKSLGTKHMSIIDNGTEQ